MPTRNVNPFSRLEKILETGLDIVRNRFFTVLIVRQAGRRFRKLRLSYPFVGLVAGIVLLVAATGLWAPRLLL